MSFLSRRQITDSLVNPGSFEMLLTTQLQFISQKYHLTHTLLRNQINNNKKSASLRIKMPHA